MHAGGLSKGGEGPTSGLTRPAYHSTPRCAGLAAAGLGEEFGVGGMGGHLDKVFVGEGGCLELLCELELYRLLVEGSQDLCADLSHELRAAEARPDHG